MAQNLPQEISDFMAAQGLELVTDLELGKQVNHGNKPVLDLRVSSGSYARAKAWVATMGDGCIALVTGENLGIVRQVIPDAQLMVHGQLSLFGRQPDPTRFKFYLA